jgi:hypothetical protein
MKPEHRRKIEDLNNAERERSLVERAALLEHTDGRVERMPANESNGQLDYRTANRLLADQTKTVIGSGTQGRSFILGGAEMPAWLDKYFGRVN